MDVTRTYLLARAWVGLGPTFPARDLSEAADGDDLDRAFKLVLKREVDRNFRRMQEQRRLRAEQLRLHLGNPNVEVGELGRLLAAMPVGPLDVQPYSTQEVAHCAGWLDLSQQRDPRWLKVPRCEVFFATEEVATAKTLALALSSEVVFRHTAVTLHVREQASMRPDEWVRLERAIETLDSEFARTTAAYALKAGHDTPLQDLRRVAHQLSRLLTATRSEPRSPASAGVSLPHDERDSAKRSGTNSSGTERRPARALSKPEQRAFDGYLYVVAKRPDLADSDDRNYADVFPILSADVRAGLCCIYSTVKDMPEFRTWKRYVRRGFSLGRPAAEPSDERRPGSSVVDRGES